MGKRPAEIWEKFERSRKEGNSGTKEICNMCRSEVQGIPERLVKYVNVF